jgi:hypothetical protein
MKAFEFEINIPADTQEAACLKANALCVLLEVLSVQDLQKFAHIVKHDKEKLKMARGFLGL